MPAHRGFPQVGGHSFGPFGHKNTPGGCSVFYAVYSVVISIVLSLFWPVVQTGINNFGIWIANSSETSPILAPFIYGTLERLLLPFVAECPLANRTGLRYNRAVTVPQRCGKGGAVMIRVAIVEDDAEVQGVLQEYVRRYTRQYGTEFEVTVFADGVDILEDYRAVYDIIFLDVEMKHLDGMTTAERIRQMDADVILIFITNMAQYAIRGYSVGALDYVLKPVPYFAFSQQLLKAVARLEKRAKHYLTVPVEGGLRRLDTASIYYLESEGHRVHFYTDEGDFSAPGALKAFEEKLADCPFARCNSGYLVNLAQVRELRQSTVQVGPCELQVSRPKRKAFLAALTDYIGGEGS